MWEEACSNNSNVICIFSPTPAFHPGVSQSNNNGECNYWYEVCNLCVGVGVCVHYTLFWSIIFFSSPIKNVSYIEHTSGNSGIICRIDLSNDIKKFVQLCMQLHAYLRGLYKGFIYQLSSINFQHIA